MGNSGGVPGAGVSNMVADSTAVPGAADSVTVEGEKLADGVGGGMISGPPVKRRR